MGYCNLTVDLDELHLHIYKYYQGEVLHLLLLLLLLLLLRNSLQILNPVNYNKKITE